MTWNENDIKVLAASGRIRGYKFTNDGKLKKKKSNKYGNKKVKVDGFTFDSKKEASRYHDLKVKQLAGEIRELKLQVKFDFEIEGKKLASYIADFTYIENGLLVVEDVKSAATRKIRLYRLKKKLMMAIYKIEIKEV